MISSLLREFHCNGVVNWIRYVLQDAEAPFEMAWLPNLADLKQTLIAYGYREHEEGSEDTESSSVERTPAKNLRSLFEFIATCFVRRKVVQPYFSAEDVAKLVVMMVHLTLERGLLEILDKIQDCILVLLRYFSPEEWKEHCSHDFNGIAGMIAEFAGKPQNSLFVLGVLSGLGKRSVELQRHLASHELTILGRRRKLLSGPREVASMFENVNLRAKFVDFKRLFYQVVIADTFLWGNEGDDAARSAWLRFLGSCSRQIYIGDERPFATRLRNTASFLVQKYEHEGSPAIAAAEG